MHVAHVPTVSYRTAKSLDRTLISACQSIAPTVRRKTLTLPAKAAVHNVDDRAVDQSSSSDRFAAILRSETSRDLVP